MDHPLAHILYISLPESLQKYMGQFSIDSSILVPAELPEGVQQGGMSLEMIINSMLKVLSYEPFHPHAEYFRRFVLAYNPNIQEEIFPVVFDKMEQNDYSTAEDLLRAMSGLDPENHALKLNLAFCLDKQHDLLDSLGREEESHLKWMEADAAYRELLELNDPILTKVPFYAGVFLLKAGKVERGIALLKQYLADDREDSLFTSKAQSLVDEFQGRRRVDHLLKEVYELILLNKEEEALKKVSQLTGEVDVSWNAWFLQGWALRRLHRYEEALLAFECVLEIDPRNMDALMEAFVCHIEREDWEAAEESLQIALSYTQEDPCTFLNYGLLAYKRQMWGEARGYFQRALETDPSDPLATKYLALIGEKA